MNTARRQRLPAEARKAEIVASALDLADSVGPEHLTTEMIAREIGVTQPAIFRHFPKKEAIWVAVAELLRARMATAWDEAADGAASPEARLRALALAQAGVIAGTPGLVAILFSRELHVHNAPLRAGLARNQQAFHALLGEAIRQAVASGAFRASLAPTDGAFLVIGVIQSLALRWSLSEKRFDLVTEAGRLLSVLITGFRTGDDTCAGA